MAEEEKTQVEKPEREGESGNKSEMEEEAEAQEAEARQLGESRLPDGEFQNSVAEARETQLETLTVTSTEHRGGSPVNSALESNGGAKLKGQDGLAHQQASLNNTEAKTQQQFQTSASPTSLLERSTASPSRSIACVASPTLPEPRSLPPNSDNGTSEVDRENSLNTKTPTTVPTVKTRVSDGYNWRKYGQKQVKSPKGSRSYYKCTHSDCCAKKIECCDDLGHVTQVVCKGQHSHDPPRKGSSTKERRHASSALVVAKHSGPENPILMLNNPDSSTSSKETMQEMLQVERKRQNPDVSDVNGENNIEEEHAMEPESKRRVKKSELAHPGSLIKPGKKPKLVVHAAGDVGISGDGYRWRKYGQKMVKGNPNPRNYYRCTSAGCPVRKHIETAVDNTNAVVITYKGIHDHDMPVPKKRHGPPSGTLVAAAAPASMSNLQHIKSDVYQKQISSTQRSADTEGESSGAALDLGSEKAIESARTLLSIGFEIKPC